MSDWRYLGSAASRAELDEILGTAPPTDAIDLPAYRLIRRLLQRYADRIVFPIRPQGGKGCKPHAAFRVAGGIRCAIPPYDPPLKDAIGDQPDSPNASATRFM